MHFFGIAGVFLRFYDIHLEREEAGSASTWEGLEDFRQECSTEQEQDWCDSETGDLRDPRGILEVSCSGSAKS